MGVGGQCLNGASIGIKEITMPDDANTSKRALFHHICRHTIAKLYDPGPNWIIHRTAQDSSDYE